MTHGDGASAVTGSVHDRQLGVMWPLLRQRALLLVLLRWGIRGFHLVSPYGLVALGSAAGHGRLVLALMLVGAGLDLGLAWLLLRSTRPLIGLRLAVEGAHAAAIAALYAWVAPTLPFSDAVAMSGSFLAEVSFRLGFLTGAATGLWLAGCAMAARLALSASLRPGDLLVYALGSALLGTVIYGYMHRQVEVAEQEALDRRQAEVQAARLQARSDLQIGRGGAIVDRLQTACFRMAQSGSADGHALRTEAATYKAAVADTVRARASYLGDVLREQAAHARREEPATARHHFFDVPVADGLFVVTAEQAAALRRQLDALVLAGHVPARLAERDLSTRSFVLDVEGERLPAPAPARPRRLFLAPAAFGGAALVLLSLSNQTYLGAPLWLTLLLAGATAVLATWSRTALAERGAAAAPAVATAAYVPLVFVITAQLLGGQQVIGGQRVLLPLLPGLSAWAFVAGTVWDLLPPLRRLWSAAVAVALAGLGEVLIIQVHDIPDPPGLIGQAAEAWLPLMALVGTIRLGRACDETETRVASRVNDQLATMVEQAVADTTAEEVAFLRARLDSASTILESLPPDSADRRAAADELAAAAEALAGLMAEPRPG